MFDDDIDPLKQLVLVKIQRVEKEQLLAKYYSNQFDLFQFKAIMQFHNYSLLIPLSLSITITKRR